MRGGVASQVHHLFQASGIKQYGNSKHQAKEEARAQGAKTWHEIGKEMGIYSYNTANAYMDVWIQAFRFAKENFGMKDLEKISGDHLAEYLKSKITAGIANSTFLQYAAALEKLETALNMYSKTFQKGNTYDFSEKLKEVRQLAQEQNLARFVGSRAYGRPEDVIKMISDPLYQLVARIQLEGGARVKEVLIGPSQLKGLRTDTITGQEKGWLAVRGKGGKWRELHITPQTYRQVEAKVKALQPGEKWGIQNDKDADAYRLALKKACQQAGESYKNKQGESKGSHGFRWNYAQNRHSEIQRAGRSYHEALAQTSREMGHERADITTHYQR